MKYLIDYVRGYLTKNEGNIEPVGNMADSDYESDFEESLIFKYTDLKDTLTPWHQLASHPLQCHLVAVESLVIMIM